jgi:hypothetical protein
MELSAIRISIIMESHRSMRVKHSGATNIRGGLDKMFKRIAHGTAQDV